MVLDINNILQTFLKPVHDCMCDTKVCSLIKKKDTKIREAKLQLNNSDNILFVLQRKTKRLSNWLFGLPARVQVLVLFG